MTMQTYAHFSDFPESEWRWPSFSPAEMATRGRPNRPDLMGGSLGIVLAAMDKLQALRDLLGKPIIINSAYRHPAYNTFIDGAPRSKHMEAIAFDISMTNHDPEAFEAAARQVGFTGFGFYRNSNFMHIDTGPAREWGQRWWTPGAGESAAFMSVEPPVIPEAPSQDDGVRGIVSAVTGGAALQGAQLVPDLHPYAQIGVVTVASLLLVSALWFGRKHVRRFFQ